MIRSRLSPALFLLTGLAACGDGAETDTEVTPATVAEEPAAEQQALIELPADFGPEGIAITGETFFVGSLSQGTAGQILAGSLTTGETRQVVGTTGVTALGLKHDPRTNYLFVAGGGSGTGHVYDAGTGTEVADFEFTEQGSTINDVELTDDAAFFTNSQQPELYRVALNANGQPGEVTTIDLPENFGTAGQCEGVPPIMGNGIVATPDGEYLILIHMSEGQLYRYEVGTGEVQPITVTGGDLCTADGLVLDGQTLYAVQNRLNQVAVVEMGQHFLTGTLQRVITEPFASNNALAIPTVAADAGDALYAVTAGFADPSPDYVVRIEK